MRNDIVDMKQLSKLFAKSVSKQTWKLPEYNPSADCDWIMASSGLPWLKLNIQVPVDIILKEIENIKDMFVDHRDDYSESLGWKGFAIHGLHETATRENEYYTDPVPYKWTDAAQEFMPGTVKYFKEQFPVEEYQRLRIMLVESNGIVGVHSDDKLPGSLGPVNIAIKQPDSCKFYMENYGVVPFTDGDAYMLNVSNRHTVINTGTEPRYHIIVHYATKTDKFRAMIEQSYRNLYAG